MRLEQREKESAHLKYNRRGRPLCRPVPIAHQKIGTAYIRRPDSHIHVFLYRIYPHLQLMCIFPLPRGTRSIVPQPGHLKNL